MDRREGLIEELRGLVAKNLDVPLYKVQLTASFKDDLDADSLDMVELVIDIEEKLGIQIDDNEAVKFVTVQDAVNYLDKAGKL